MGRKTFLVQARLCYVHIGFPLIVGFVSWNKVSGRQGTIVKKGIFIKHSHTVFKPSSHRTGYPDTSNRHSIIHVMLQ